MLKVAIKRSDYSNVEENIREAINLVGGIHKFINKTDKVLLKPNLLRAISYEKGVTTNPKVVEAVVKIVKEVNDNIYLGDSSAIGSIEHSVKVCGLKEICDKYNVKLVKFEGKDFKVDGELVKSFNVFKDFRDYKIINLPKLKTHSLMKYTGAMKNLFGMVPGFKKSKMHLRFEDGEVFFRMIKDLNKLVKPTLSIMDGIVGMEGEGPNGGELRNFNFIAVSEDTMALDKVCSRLMGFKLKCFNVKVEEVGDKIEDVKDLKKPKTMGLSRYLKPFRKYFVAIPLVDSKKCISCKACFKVCPANAIKMNKYPIFDYKKCIKCYSCKEVCFSGAIYLKRNIIMKILRL